MVGAELRALWTLILVRLVVAGIVVGWAPYYVVSSAGTRDLIWSIPTAVPGVLAIGLGVIVYVHAGWVFAVSGRSLAPNTLLVQGMYRFVRNPMFLGLVFVIVGEALVFGSWRLAAYAASFWLLVHLVVVLYEEPSNAKRFGTAFEQYSRSVPRWLPRLGRLWNGIL